MSEDGLAANSEEMEVVYLDEGPIVVQDLAGAVNRSSMDLLKVLVYYGQYKPISAEIDWDLATLVCEELGIDLRAHGDDSVEPSEEQEPADEPVPAVSHKVRSRMQGIWAAEPEDSLEPRPLVVTVLGHVDHGKTTLLDTIRKSSVVDTEAGGITQSIGAYQVAHSSDGEEVRITFIDTPGHQAFTQMRARGAEVTDLVILVVAADDGLMPQTQEAIDHARAAGVPIIVAVNKIDRPNANVNNVMSQLSNTGLTPADWGGDVHMIPLSALNGDNVDDLLDTILLMTDDLAPTANPKGQVAGTVLEAHVDRQQGITTNVLVQNGTLRQGDTVVIGETWGRIKAMSDQDGVRVKEAGPSSPVQVLGISDPPEAGEMFKVVGSKKKAVRLIDSRIAERQSVRADEMVQPQTLEDLMALLEKGDDEDVKKLQVVVKADVQGSLDPVVSSLQGINHPEVQIEVLRSGVGNVTENDVMLAEASTVPVVILGFNVSSEPTAEQRGRTSGVDIRTYDIIYHLIEDVEKALNGLLAPKFEEVVIGQAQVRQEFPVKGGVAAGCIVIDGIVRNNALVKFLRPGQPERLTRVTELRRFRDRVDTVQSGQDCGIRLEDIDSFRDGDLIEVYEERQAPVA
ncbi:MAG: translation initiation factor IF-2 [Caldilineaceae bacterium SB0665_bin_21]|nr:translation initiation factor IF-2 [Caldilineaceae bacterium SB0665_bin_21]MYA05698.1 translation initiation factor IF-2 [Caldilineaceae bacterium SB0664_bin_22]MYC64474.1 translation initiation factor IF-2 [Caldilineaceae bacterium SB0661_bin_34]